MPLLLASLTGPLVTFATNLIADLGLIGVALMTGMTGVVGVPGTEPTMLFAGFDVFQGNLTLPGILIAGTIGDVAGAVIAYAIGYYGRRELLERQGSKLHVRASSLDRAHRWFDRWGTPVIFVSRLLPFIRAVFPYAAGVAKMPFRRFFPLVVLGSLVWITALGLLGDAVGSQWQSWRHHLEYVDYVGVAVLVIGIVYLVVRHNRRRATGGPQGDPATDVIPE